MSSPTTFVTLLSRSFVSVSLLLYLVGCLVLFIFQRQESRRDLHYLLYSEAEALASYHASTGRLDFPELEELEKETPVPVWLRLLDGHKVVAATPGAPELTEPLPAALPEGTLGEVHTREGRRLFWAGHEVWNHPGLHVQAFAEAKALSSRLAVLLRNLALTALILIPVSAIVGRVSAWALLAPLADLVRAVGTLEPADLSRRLSTDTPVREVSALAGEFNKLLGRVEGVVARMRRFTADASHELRTPVASLKAGIEVCLRRQRSAPEYEELLREQLVEIDRIERTVEGLLTMARDPDDRAAALPAAPVAVAKVVEAALRTVRPLLAEKRLRLRLEGEADVTVEGDEAQLVLMLVNLLDNAVRHGPQGSEVAVELAAADGEARILVSDQGPGVSPEDRPFIFERHFQGDSPRERRPGRVGGIGLDLVRWVAERHHGSVRLLEGGPGARFEVRLPVSLKVPGGFRSPIP